MQKFSHLVQHVIKDPSGLDAGPCPQPLMVVVDRIASHTIILADLPMIESANVPANETPGFAFEQKGRSFRLPDRNEFIVDTHGSARSFA